jgi:hypothetical protein
MEPQGQKPKDGRAGNDGGNGLDRRSVQTESKQSLQHDGATFENGATEREGCPIKRDGTHTFGGTFAQPLSSPTPPPPEAIVLDPISITATHGPIRSFKYPGMVSVIGVEARHQAWLDGERATSPGFDSAAGLSPGDCRG